MLMRFDGAYGSALFQLEVLQLVNQARADQGLAPHRRPGPHGGRPDPGGGAHDPLLPHPAGRAQLLHRVDRGRRGLLGGGGEHRRRLPHPRGGGGGLDGLRRPPGQHPQRGLYFQMGLGYAPAEDGMATTGPSSSWAEQPNKGKDPGSEDPGPFFVGGGLEWCTFPNVELFVDVQVHHTANPPGLQGVFPKCQNCSVCLQNYTFPRPAAHLSGEKKPCPFPANWL